MPNWCNNNISIAGPVETIKALYDEAILDADDETGLLNAMAPMPVELHDTTSPSDTPNWYDWRVENWGTKWEVSSEGLEFIDNGDGTAVLQGWFDSAWAPPIGAYEKFCDDMDNCSLSASYYEPGMDFAGFWEDGVDEMIEDLHSQSKLPEEEQDELFRRIDEEFGISEQFEMWDEEEETL